ncbi:hypothetical protein AAFF_G00306280 [Aldrovandia affinis]|uniref:UBP-type domain-containing protein n=1 Tax=Aldrovandia affinis TaxID=143900 RepID=A0AAD7SPC3_9TELE|nr:hypothetical protein AAFF_G00306280 [Aldrovandia affinis]
MPMRRQSCKCKYHPLGGVATADAIFEQNRKKLSRSITRRSGPTWKPSSALVEVFLLQIESVLKNNVAGGYIETVSVDKRRTRRRKHALQRRHRFVLTRHPRRAGSAARPQTSAAEMSPAAANSDCPHLECVGEITKEELIQKSHGQCLDCKVSGPNLWACLENGCSYVGCGESHADHSTVHSQDTRHNLTVNLTTLRVWCYACGKEVFLDRKLGPRSPAAASKPHSHCRPPLRMPRPPGAPLL